MLIFPPISVRSLIELVEFLFEVPDVMVFLSNQLCQDPLEKIFVQLRHRGTVNENPNSKDFIKNMQTLRVINGV